MGKRLLISLSPDAEHFKNTPAAMPIIEDIYSISDRRAWVVVCTEFQQEPKVMKEFEQAKVSAFMPVERQYVRKVIIRETTIAGIVQKRRQKTIRRPVDRPLLPGYLFAEVPLTADGTVGSEAAAKVHNTEGVVRILGSAQGPIPIPGQFVEELRKQQLGGAFDRTRKVRPAWAVKGATVRVAEGPFASFLADIEACLPNDMIKVAVQIFGRATPVTMELAQLEEMR